MKKKNVINLIKYYSEKKDDLFRNEAIEIARYFDSIGDYQLSQYIIMLLSDTNSFVPQNEAFDNAFFKEISLVNEPLPLPLPILDDVKGIMNAIEHQAGVNKFLFEGPPGTGKTQTVKHIAKLLGRKLYSVDFNMLIDSKLGQSAKNINSVFEEINNLPYPENIIILFDEIDAIALDRIGNNDIREMGRVTSTILKELDSLSDQIVIIATTNLYGKFDKALSRRFDAIINFDRYSKEDLVDVAVVILKPLLVKFKNAGQDMRLFKKIIANMPNTCYPGDLKNQIKTSLAFSDPNSEFDYLIRLMKLTTDENDINVKSLHEKGFTLREIELLTGVSKSQASRELKINE